MFSTNPSAFSSSFNALDEFPIFAVPAITDLIPVPEPVNCGYNVKFG